MNATEEPNVTASQPATDPKSQPDASGHGHGKLSVGLTARHIQFIALGSAIGTGLFYASADAIRLAGPAVLLAYVVAGLAVFMVMRALGEMALRDPSRGGSFGYYARRYLGPSAGFLIGWMFIIEMLVVAIADVTAISIYLARWWPHVPSWVWIVGVILLVTGLNLIHVKVFGETEFWLSIIKVGAIIAMIVGGLAIMIFHIGQPGSVPPGVNNLVDHGGFAPTGVLGILLSFAVVVFAFGGVETLGTASAEVQDPHRNLPRAINTIPWRILLFYVLSIGVILCLIPWTDIDGENSPFVQIFDVLGIAAAGDLLNIVAITASFSALNADSFAIGRMLHGLAAQGDAPKKLGETNKRGVPFAAVIMVAGALVVGLILNAVVEEGLFMIVASIATYATVFVWLMILISHIAMTHKIRRGEIEQGPFQAPGGLMSTYLAAAFMVMVIVLFAFDASTVPALIVGLVGTVVLVAVELLVVRPRRRQLHLD
ncbi:amino acid permease [Gulosibacter bifidus]|uniref:Amino acid permease n=1 Tax=Gulosibacter bifidus TaxID=272239 RepID=A0ABW5RJD6_9MICO|nr:amino acid permease [Gulosibacter bifidus]